MLPRIPDNVERRYDDHHLNACSLHGRWKVIAEHGSQQTVFIYGVVMELMLWCSRLD